MLTAVCNRPLVGRYRRVTVCIAHERAGYIASYVPRHGKRIAARRAELQEYVNPPRVNSGNRRATDGPDLGHRDRSPRGGIARAWPVPDGGSGWPRYLQSEDPRLVLAETELATAFILRSLATEAGFEDRDIRTTQITLRAGSRVRNLIELADNEESLAWSHARPLLACAGSRIPLRLVSGG